MSLIYPSVSLLLAPLLIAAASTDPNLTISNVEVTGITKSSALFNWDGSEAAYMNLAFGITSGYGYLNSDEWTASRAPYGHHFFFLSGLAPGTTYHFCPQIVDPHNGNTSPCDGTTNDYIFTTAGGNSTPVPPTLPQATVDTTMPTVTGDTFYVNTNCDNLQQQIDAAAAGDGTRTQQIIIQAGTVCTGVYTAPARPAATGWVIVRTSTPDGQLPPAGVRVTPAQRPLLATIQDDGWNSSNVYRLQAGQSCSYPDGHVQEAENLKPGDPTSFDVLICHSGTWAPASLVGSGTTVPATCHAGTENDGDWFFKTDETLYYRMAWLCVSTNHYLNMNFNRWPIGAGTAMTVLSGANHYRFIGIDVTNVPTPSYGYHDMDYGNLITVSPGADHIVFDHIYLHGAPSPSKESIGIELEGSDVAVVDSHIEKLTKYRDTLSEVEDNSNAIQILEGPGPTRIENNYLSAAGIVVFCTDDEGNAVNLAHPPADVSFLSNYVHGDPSYDDGSSASNGYHYFNRNMLELKFGVRWLISGNVFDGNFAQMNQGAAIVLLGRPTAPYPIANTSAQVADISISNNIIRNVPTGILVGGFTDNANGEILETSRIKITNNLLENIDGNLVSPNGTYPNGEYGLAATVELGPEDIVFDHNTAYQLIGNGPTSVAFDSGSGSGSDPHPGVGFQFTNNIAWNHTVYSPLFGGGGGIVALNANFQTRATTVEPAWNVTGNVIMFDSTSAGANQSAINPAGNVWVPDQSGPGFADPAGGDYTLTNQSIKGTATDGADPGVNMAELLSATANTITGGSGYATNPASSGPLLYDISANSVSGTTASITWETDWTATSAVQYGTSSDYGRATDMADATAVSCPSQYTPYVCRGVGSHVVTLTSLLPATTYHYAVTSTDQYGNVSTSLDQTFTTGGTPPAPAISDITISTTSTGAIISWATDTLSDSSVSYGLTTSYNQSSGLSRGPGVTVHSVTLSNLSVDTTYHYSVMSTDRYGNTARSSDQTFTTADVPAPVISQVTASVTSTTVLILWVTDTLSDSSVQYGLTTSYNQSARVSRGPGVTVHSVTISNLSLDATYHYVVTSTDQYGHTTISPDATFTITGPPHAPVISDITVVLTWAGAVIFWRTDTPSNSQVQYGIAVPYDESSGLSENTGVTAHSVTLTGLSSNTTYYFAVESTALNGASSVSASQTFTTHGTIKHSHRFSGGSPVGGPEPLAPRLLKQPASLSEGSSIQGDPAIPLSSAPSRPSDGSPQSLIPSGSVSHLDGPSGPPSGSVNASEGSLILPGSAASPAPAISDVAASLTSAGVTISWKTDTPSNSQVQYGLTTAGNESSGISDGLGVTVHSVTLSNLSFNRTYHYAVKSIDLHGGSSVSAEQTFITRGARLR